MRIKGQIATSFLATAMLLAPAIGRTEPPAQDNGAQAKQDMHQAGRDTKDAARNAGRGVKHGTKKAYHSTKRHTKRAWHRTKNTVRGAKQGAEQPPQ